MGVIEDFDTDILFSNRFGKDEPNLTSRGVGISSYSDPEGSGVYFVESTDELLF